jgi:nucleotide-binding universal stress UspA family protein
MSLAWPVSDQPLLLILRAQAKSYLDTCAKTLPSGRVGAVRVEVGVPWQAVCAAAIDEGADLVVIGSHGYSVLDHLIGTTAAKIVNHADRSVLVVRTPVPKA